MNERKDRLIYKDNLERKQLTLVESIVSLTAQGYIVNNKKKYKFDYMTIMLHALENMSVFDDKRQENLIVLYNKLEEM